MLWYWAQCPAYGTNAYISDNLKASRLCVVKASKIIGALIQLVPGFSWCLDSVGAWMQLVPGFNWCLDATGAWMQLVDKIRPERCSGVAVS